MSHRDLEPIPVEDRPEKPEKVSQTLLSRQAVCPRSALLYHQNKGGPTSLQMDRGSCFHSFAAKATHLLVEQGEPMLPPDVAKDLMQEEINDAEWTISPGEADRLRVAAYHFAEGFTIDPEGVLAIEQLIEMDVGPFVFRGKPDLVYQVDDSTIAIDDYKTGFGAFSSQEEFEGSFQLPGYATLLAFGTVEGGLPLGARDQYFRVSEVYPFFDLRDDGQMARREKIITRAELADHRAYIEGLAAKLDRAFDTGEWPAVPGSHCGTCARRSACPLPRDLRGPGGALETAEAAQEAAEQWFLGDKALKELKAAIRAYAKSSGEAVPIGSDMELAFKEEVSETWRTGKKIGRPDADAAKQAMLAAIDRAVQFGEEFDYGEYRVARSSSKFGPRKLEPGEVDVGV